VTPQEESRRMIGFQVTMTASELDLEIKDIE
jgi:hypothetical protein